MVSYWNLFAKMTKTFHIPSFYLFFVVKDPLKKLEVKHQNSTSTIFWSILLCSTRGAYSIWKKGWQTDGGTARHRISSADYVSIAANKNPCLSSGTYCISMKELVHKKTYLWYKIYFLSLSRQMVIWLSRGQHQRPRSLGTTPVSEWISHAT